MTASCFLLFRNRSKRTIQMLCTNAWRQTSRLIPSTEKGSSGMTYSTAACPRGFHPNGFVAVFFHSTISFQFFLCRHEHAHPCFYGYCRKATHYRAIMCDVCFVFTPCDNVKMFKVNLSTPISQILYCASKNTPCTFFKMSRIFLPFALRIFPTLSRRATLCTQSDEPHYEMHTRWTLVLGLI